MEGQGMRVVVLNNNNNNNNNNGNSNNNSNNNNSSNNSNNNNNVRMVERRGRGQEGTYRVGTMISIDLDMSGFLGLPTLYIVASVIASMIPRLDSCS